MPPIRRSLQRSEGQVTHHHSRTPIPESTALNGLVFNELRALCQEHGLATRGNKASLKKQLILARQSQNNDNILPQNDQDGADHVERRQDSGSLLNEAQLTQVRSLIDESIGKAAQAAAQAAVAAFTSTTVQTGTETAENTPTGTQERQENIREILTISDLEGAIGPKQPTSVAEDSVHELPAKLVKEALNGEFMELSRLLPKNINLLGNGDEPLTLTVENSVIKLSHSNKTTSITNIDEWTSAFSAYMSVIISSSPERAAELLEYMSLIRYAAKYHQGLGWCVYDIKFRQKAANNKSLKWSVIDSQLWLKTFTVSPSRMKEEIGFSQSGPFSAGTRGDDNRTCHNYNKGYACARTPCMFAHKCNRTGCGKDHPGYKCPSSPPTQNCLSPTATAPTEGKNPPPDTTVGEKNNFNTIVTPVNVSLLRRGLSGHPNQSFVNKLCSELTDGAHIGYSGPRSPAFLIICLLPWKTQP